ncbi:PKD domain-containing protein [bacterium]|nr:PKD domain-containing protein [bacterium]
MKLKYLVLLCLVSNMAFSWDLGSNTGTSATDPFSSGNNPQIVQDGSGGAIVFWVVSSSNVIKAQRFDADGVRLWGTTGITITTASVPSSNVKAVPDNTGGAIVVWNATPSTNSEIYAAKVDSSGAVQWQETAISSGYNETLEDISTDGSGGVLIACLRYVSSNPWVYAQRVNSSGSILWGAGGTQVSTMLTYQESPDISPDGSGGAFIAWAHTDDSGRSSIQANRLNSSGSGVSGFAKVIAYSRSGDQFRFPKTTADSNGGIWIAYIMGMSDTEMNIYANYYSNTAAVGTQLTLCTASDYQEPIELVSDGANGAILVWEDKRNFSTNEKDIYAIAIRSGGTVAWSANGVSIANSSGNEDQPDVYPNGSQGAVFVWRTNTGTETNIETSIVLSDGSYAWGGKLALCDASGSQSRPVVTATGTGNFIAAWADGRNSGVLSIYAQNICPGGTIGDCTAGMPIALFDYTPTTGKYPLIVDFDGSTSYDPDGTVVTWDWDFGDTNTDTGTTTSNTYASAGVYTITLTVTDNVGLTGTTSKTITVLNSDPPVALFDLTPTAGNSPLDVDFDGSASYDPDGIIISWAWNFGDGNSGTGATISHTYTNPGNYTITLTVTDDTGISSSISKTLRVNESDPPVALFDCIPSSGKYPLTVSFDASSSYDPDGTIVSWTWNFGDGNSGTGVNVSHTYLNQGDYTATLTVTDNSGRTSNRSKIIQVTLGEPPVAVINAEPIIGIPPLTVTFDGSNSFDPDGNIIKYQWSFGDGVISPDITTSHLYQNEGVYVAKLKVTDDNNNTATSSIGIFAKREEDIKAVLTLSPIMVKARGQGIINAACQVYTNSQDPNTDPVWDLVKMDIGLSFAASSGGLLDNRLFIESTSSTTQSILSGEPGTVTVYAVLGDITLATATASFIWPQAPANINVVYSDNRGLFKGESIASLSWTANSAEYFPIVRYRIYCSQDNKAFEMIAELSSDTFDYVDSGLNPKSKYSYKMTSIDSDGDESDFSETFQK